MATVFQVLDDDGTPMDAEFHLDGTDVIFHAGGGETNQDYDDALRLLLSRIEGSPLKIEQALLDTKSKEVQALSPEMRVILAPADVADGLGQAFSIMKARMPKTGQRPGAKGGNGTKRIRLRLLGDHTPEEIGHVLKGRPVKKDLRSRKRLPVAELQKVSKDDVWEAVQKLLDEYDDHGFGQSTDYDLIADGRPLPPKAVFGLAASQALGFKVLPEHFTGGVGTPCFRILEKAGFEIVPKGEAPKMKMAFLSREDREWAEGNLRLVTHLKKERGSGLAREKKAAFIQEHGRLFCERCQTDASAIDSEFGDACIEVHHAATPVAEMDPNHRTKPEDLQCLCANCHRIVHREIKVKAKRQAQADK